MRITMAEATRNQTPRDKKEQSPTPPSNPIITIYGWSLADHNGRSLGVPRESLGGEGDGEQIPGAKCCSCCCCFFLFLLDDSGFDCGGMGGGPPSGLKKW